jgi:hypothetical protein
MSPREKRMPLYGASRRAENAAARTMTLRPAKTAPYPASLRPIAAARPMTRPPPIGPNAEAAWVTGRSREKNTVRVATRVST